MVDTNHCVTCGHHRRDHDEELGCQRCSTAAHHPFLSSKAADRALIALGSDLMEPVEEVPGHIELQARLYALDMAVKAYDLVTEVMDTPPGIEWIDGAAERYIRFLLKKEYS